MTCSHCRRHEAAPDRKMCPACLETKARARKRASSPEGLGNAVKLLAKEGKQIVKARPRRRILKATTPQALVREVEMLEKYGRRR